MLKYIWTVLLCATLAAIFILTEQTPQQTTALSSRADAAVSRAVGTGDGRASVAGAQAGADASSGSQAAPFTVMGQGVRRLAHVVEFFYVGAFALLAARAWNADGRFLPAGGRGRLLLLVVVLVFCVAMSLFDQTHKLFVPGREFDCMDLIMDAIGYLSGIAAGCIAAAAGRALGGVTAAFSE